MINRTTQVTAKSALIGLVLTALVACAHDPYSVVVVDANDLSANKTTEQYIVQKGDTLYSIAFRFGTTVYAVARRNGLSEPYVIYSGQTLNVINAGPQVEKIAAVSKLKPSGLKPNTSVAKASKPPKPKRQKKVVTKAPLSSLNWALPSKGVIGKHFSEGKVVHKGIDFIAPKGSPVLAARAGKVVYAGNGLKAYGLLIIIKHDQQYLSASAYNQKLLVKEGDTVKQGQKIALVGKKGDESMLHFEIRKNGKPINPLLLLPVNQ